MNRNELEIQLEDKIEKTIAIIGLRRLTPIRRDHFITNLKYKDILNNYFLYNKSIKESITHLSLEELQHLLT